MITATKTNRKAVKRKSKEKAGIALPESTTTVEIGGVSYFVTPTTDMKEWLEDMEDVLDSMKALEEPGESIPFDQAMKNLGIKLPARRPKKGK